MRIILLSIAIALIPWVASAQNTGGVFPPGFDDDHRSLQYRITVDPDDGDWAQRLHFQTSVNDRVLWRVVGQTRSTGNSDIDFDYVQGEVFWQLTPHDRRYETGLRFDGRLRDGDRPEQVGLNWMNQWTLNDGWRVRAVGLSRLELGGNADGDILLEARGQLARTLSNGWTVGGEAYLPLGDTNQFRILVNESASVGPFVSVPFGNKRAVLLQPLFGVTEAARDVELRLWLTQGF